jgi:hypothetical protein
MFSNLKLPLSLTTMTWLAWACLDAQAQSISFRNEVMAVLSKAGCNQGACHGNQNGKNGFKLSLRGEDPDWDYHALTRDMLGRRVNKDHPAESLILLKPIAAIPHEGGRRFIVDSLEYQILAKWIMAGTPHDHAKAPVVKKITANPTEQIVYGPDTQVCLRVQATFTDGAVHDVTRLAVYEPSNPNVEISPQGEIVNPLARGDRFVRPRPFDLSLSGLPNDLFAVEFMRIEPILPIVLQNLVANAGEECGQAVVILLRPLIEGMIVALGALQSDAQEHLSKCLGLALRVAECAVKVGGRLRVTASLGRD